MPRNGTGGDALSPRLAALLERVRMRMAAAPTVSLIRQVADEALAMPRDDLSAAEIQQLADVAIDRARQVESCASRLAELLTEGAR